MTAGLGIYLDGLNLPDEVYEQCDSNHVFEQLSERIDGLGEICSWWQGPSETALYMYGQSFEAMRDAIAEFVGSYPCARTHAWCRSPEGGKCGAESCSAHASEAEHGLGSTGAGKRVARTGRCTAPD